MNIVTMLEQMKIKSYNYFLKEKITWECIIVLQKKTNRLKINILELL